MRNETPEQITQRSEAIEHALRKVWKGRDRGPDWSLGMKDRLDVFILATYEAYDIQGQVDLLHAAVKKSRIVYRRRRLIRSGLLDITKRARSARIGEVHHREILRLYDEGWSVLSIASILTCSQYRVERVINLRGQGRLRKQKTFSQQDLIRVFGGMESMVRTAIGKGWITGGQVGPSLYHNYALADVIDFLRMREGWALYEPRHITDPDIRRSAELIRQADPGRWLSIADLHAALDLPHTTIVDMFVSKRFEGYETAKIFKSYYLWLPAGWDLPIIRKSLRRGVPHEVISRSHVVIHQSPSA